jgi:hypothetical protein
MDDEWSNQVKKGRAKMERSRKMRVSVSQLRATLSGIPAANTLEFSEDQEKIIVRIPRDLFLSNEDFQKIHEKLAQLGGRYLEGEKAWEIRTP